MKPKDPLYFITLIPPTPIKNEVEKFKEEIKEKFGIKHALKLPAHITIQIPFRIPEKNQDFLIKKVEEFSKGQNAWKVQLEDFGKFDKKVIYIKIKDHDPFIFLYEDLQKLLLSFIDLKSHELASKMHPHITIATRDLKRSHFPEIWDDFKDRHYRGSFILKDLYLFKHNGTTWDSIRKFALGN